MRRRHTVPFCQAMLAVQPRGEATSSTQASMTKRSDGSVLERW
jgi:hypothetical protein